MTTERERLEAEVTAHLAPYMQALRERTGLTTDEVRTAVEEALQAFPHKLPAPNVQVTADPHVAHRIHVRMQIPPLVLRDIVTEEPGDTDEEAPPLG